MGPEELFSFGLGGILLMIPIVAILTAHQRKMAEIIHGAQRPADTEVRQEVDELRRLVVRQSMEIDALKASHRELLQLGATGEPIHDRLGQNR